jgi:hypothetical protein
MNKKVNVFEEAEKKPKKASYSGDSYTDDYNQFMENFRFQEISSEEVGEMVARMAQHFATHNLIMIRSLKVYAKLKSELHAQPDGATGKPMTSSKAEMIAAATPEAHAYEEARAHVQNIEQMMNALKALQRGIMFEYQHQ